VASLPTEQNPIRILSASFDHSLNESRAVLLRHHGFDTITTESEQTAVELLESQPFHFLIFGSTLGTDTCWKLAVVYRKYNPKGKVIEIIPSQWASPKNQPDATVVSSEPGTLIATIRNFHVAA
jgi:hypothetical protein